MDLNPRLLSLLGQTQPHCLLQDHGHSMGAVTGRTSVIFGGLHLFLVVVLPGWVTFISLNLNFFIFIKTEIMGLGRQLVHNVLVLASVKTQV